PIRFTRNSRKKKLLPLNKTTPETDDLTRFDCRRCSTTSRRLLHSVNRNGKTRRRKFRFQICLGHTVSCCTGSRSSEHVKSRYEVNIAQSGQCLLNHNERISQSCQACSH